MNNSILPKHLVAFIMLSLTSIFAINVMIYDHAYLYGENQLMEHIQILILLIVGALFWYNSSPQKWKSVEQSAPSLRLLAYLGAALCFSFIVREMSVKKSGIDWFIFLVDGQGYKILMALIWVPLLYKAYQFKGEYIEIVKKTFLSNTSIFLAIAASLLLSGGLFDKEIIVVEYFRFYEEVLEMNGYGFMLLAALSFHRDMIFAVCPTNEIAAKALIDVQENHVITQVIMTEQNG
jgi:hypothetical protein